MDFKNRRKTFNKSSVKTYLEGLKAPCYENDIMKAAFGTAELTSEALELYQMHFVLFHELYRLQSEYAQEGYYLHIHFMRTYLLPYPTVGHCFYYNPDGYFCKTKSSEAYCSFHREQIGEKALEDVSIKYFYLDEKNYESVSGEDAEDFIRGTWELMTTWDKVDEARRLLDLPSGFDKAMVRRKFKKLAKTFHPDVSNRLIVEREDEFIKINSAYRFLVSLKALK